MMQVINTAAAGGFHKKTVFTSSGVFTPDKNTKVLFVELVAGGGSGAARYSGGSSGGGGGQYVSAWLTVGQQAIQPAVVMVGAGGASVSVEGNSNTSGTSGGDSEFSGFGKTYRALGGVGAYSGSSKIAAQRSVVGHDDVPADRHLIFHTFSSGSPMFAQLPPGCGGVPGAFRALYGAGYGVLEQGVFGGSFAAGGGAASGISGSGAMTGSGSQVAGVGGSSSWGSGNQTAGDGEFPGGGGGGVYSSTLNSLIQSGAGGNGCVTIWEFK